MLSSQRYVVIIEHRRLSARAGRPARCSVSALADHGVGLVHHVVLAFPFGCMRFYSASVCASFTMPTSASLNKPDFRLCQLIPGSPTARVTLRWRVSSRVQYEPEQGYGEPMSPCGSCWIADTRQVANVLVARGGTCMAEPQKSRVIHAALAGCFILIMSVACASTATPDISMQAETLITSTATQVPTATSDSVASNVDQRVFQLIRQTVKQEGDITQEQIEKQNAYFSSCLSQEVYKNPDSKETLAQVWEKLQDDSDREAWLTLRFMLLLQCIKLGYIDIPMWSFGAYIPPPMPTRIRVQSTPDFLGPK